MPQLRVAHSLRGPFDDPDPLAELLLFLRTNGYTLVEAERGELPTGLASATTPASEAPTSQVQEGDDAAGGGENDDDERGGDEAEDAPVVAATLSRGERGGGWWSSDMTRLPTVLRLGVRGDTITFDYDVDVSGQRLSDEERRYWEREATSAGRYLAGEGDIVNWRQIEGERATRERRGRLRWAVYLAAVVFVALFVLQMIFVY